MFFLILTMLICLIPIIAASVEGCSVEDMLSEQLMHLEIQPAKRMQSLVSDANQAITFARIQAEMTEFERFATKLNRESARIVKAKANELEALIDSNAADILPLLEEVRELTNLADPRRVSVQERAVAKTEWQAQFQMRRSVGLSVFSDYHITSGSTFFTAEDIAIVAFPLIASSAELKKLFRKLPLDDSLEKLTELFKGNLTSEYASHLLKKSPLQFVATSASRAYMARFLEEFLTIAISIDRVGPYLFMLIQDYLGASPTATQNGMVE